LDYIPTPIEDTLVDGLTHILKRFDLLDGGDQYAIASEYKEWIECIDNKKFRTQDILFINKNNFGRKIK
jgi:hypothetical protein